MYEMNGRMIPNVEGMKNIDILPAHRLGMDGFAKAFGAGLRAGLSNDKKQYQEHGFVIDHKDSNRLLY
ncbi:MAG: hypothetical protein NT120_03710 [Candidatus Aenigmarchaeota archaeon]|nr:hypothetical protein [Candidatus Aenigmarchaeota archaeon]